MTRLLQQVCENTMLISFCFLMRGNGLNGINNAFSMHFKPILLEICIEINVMTRLLQQVCENTMNCFGLKVVQRNGLNGKRAQKGLFLGLI